MMDGSGNNKDWPTLNDSNVACASGIKSKHRENSKKKPRSKVSSNVSRTNEEKGTSNKKTYVTDGANGLANASTSTYSNTGARKKQSGKTRWSRVHVDCPSYRDNRNERNYNESHKFASGRRYNNYEPAPRFRRETTVNSDSRRYNSYSQEVASSHGVNLTRRKPAFPKDFKEQIRRQIEYYFSAENLIRGSYLRCHMDEQGYADIKLVSEFPRMKRLTSNLELILNAVKESSHLEVSDDGKVRPVIDPLRWPLKKVVRESNVVNASNPLFDYVPHFYTLPIYPRVNHSCPVPGPIPHLPGETLWSSIPVGVPEKNEALFCVNDVYPHANTINYIGEAAVSLEIGNGHVSPPGQQSPNSDFHCELPSQFIPNNYGIQNGNVLGTVPATPVLPNGVRDISGDSNSPHGQTRSPDHVPLPCNGEFSSHDLRSKTEDSFHPNGDFENNASARESNVSNGLECSSDLRHMSEICGYDCFGSNGVIMYNNFNWQIQPF